MTTQIKHESFWSEIYLDAKMYEVDLTIFTFLPLFFLKAGWRLVFYYRVQTRLMKYGVISAIPRKLLSLWAHFGTACEISPRAKIDSGLYLPHPIGIVIGRDVVIGKNCSIFQHVTLGQNNDLYPTVKDHCTLYAGAVVIGNVTIGKNSTIGANAVVVKDIPPHAIAVGVPAKVL